MLRIIMITGGQRSGKSLFAERMALRLSDAPVYVATARVLDDEFAARVDAHRLRRGPEWTTVEIPLEIDRLDVVGRTALVDCLTMLATNWFFECGEDHAAAFDALSARLDSCFSRHSEAPGDTTLIIVTNEIGLGGVSPDAMTRHFTDLQGRLNQYVATRADEVYMTVSGLPLRLR